MYLVIGHDADPFSQRVAAALRGRGHETVLTPEPITAAGTLTWALDTWRSESRVAGLGGRDAASTDLRGVFVRALGAPLAPDDWAPDDFAYAQTETSAALLAWLWELPCPVVNRLDADLWFRPQRAYPEWIPLLLRCGLPVLAVQITNDLPAARGFAAALGGTVTYAPLTAPARYPIREEPDWEELAKVMAVAPVALVERGADAAHCACLAGREVVWDGHADPPRRQREAVETGLRRLAAMLRLDLLHIEVRSGRAGLCCTGVELYPPLAFYHPTRQEALVAGIVARLEARS